MSEARTQVIDLGIPNFRLDAIPEKQLLEHVAESWSERRGGWIVTVNVDILRRIETNRSFSDLIATATVRVPDGMPIVWAARLLGVPRARRIAGADLLWTLTSIAARESRRVYFIGGNPGAAKDAVDALEARSPGFHCVGIDVPQIEEEAGVDYQRELVELANRVAATDPHLVFVALGSPKQDWVIARLREAVPTAWFVGVGIALSFASGEIPRAPLVFQRWGLEWTYRLVQEPSRLFHRYVVDDMPYAARLLAWAAAHRLVPAARGSAV